MLLLHKMQWWQILTQTNKTKKKKKKPTFECGLGVWMGRWVPQGR
jgi:hypothetical protein